MTRQLKHVRLRRKRRLCGWEGCSVRSGRNYYCAEHLRRRRELYALRIARRAAEGAA